MDEFTYVEDVPQTPEGFDNLKWDEGERPRWWREHYDASYAPFWQSYVWYFTSDGHVWALDDLERFCDVFPHLRRELFLNAPVGGTRPTTVGHFNVSRIQLPEYLKEQLQRRSALLKTLSDLEARINPAIALLGDELAASGGIEHLTGSGEGELGIPLAYLDEISQGGKFYDLRNALALAYQADADALAERRAKKADEAEKRRIETEKRRAERTAVEEEKARHQKVMRFIGYLKMPDFDPRTPQQEEALRLYQEHVRTQDNQTMFALQEFIREAGLA